MRSGKERVIAAIHEERPRRGSGSRGRPLWLRATIGGTHGLRHGWDIRRMARSIGDALTWGIRGVRGVVRIRLGIIRAIVSVRMATSIAAIVVLIRLS